MEHVLWVVLVAFLGVNDITGLPTIRYDVYSTHLRHKECMQSAAPLMADAKKTPEIDVQCVSFPHDMIF